MPDSGNTALPLYPYPTVELLDNVILERVTNLGWIGRSWFVRLPIQESNGETMEFSAEFNSNNASAIFTDVLITQPGWYMLELMLIPVHNKKLLLWEQQNQSQL